MRDKLVHGNKKDTSGHLIGVRGVVMKSFFLAAETTDSSTVTAEPESEEREDAEDYDEDNDSGFRS